jgi:hypothetical protein
MTTTRREELPDLPFRRYYTLQKPVIAMRLQESEAVPNPFATGGFYRAESGAWKVCYGERADGTADVALVDPQVFEETYEHLAGHHYRKKSHLVIEAAQLEAPLDVVTLEGPAHGEPGDWLMLDVLGHPYFNSDAYFRENYTLAD